MSVWNMKQILPVILKYCIQYLHVHVQFFCIISAYKRRQLYILEVQQESQGAAMSSHSDTAWRRFKGWREESQSSCRAWYSSGCRDYKQGTCNINFICPIFVDFHITEMCCNQNGFFFFIGKAECFPEHFHTISSTDC